MVIIRDSNKNISYLQISADGALQAEGLEQFIAQLNHLGGNLFQDIETGKVFEIKEIKYKEPE